MAMSCSANVLFLDPTVDLPVPGVSVDAFRKKDLSKLVKLESFSSAHNFKAIFYLKSFRKKHILQYEYVLSLLRHEGPNSLFQESLSNAS